MSRLPVCCGVEAVKAFRKIGYELDHQTGSHMIPRHPSSRRLTVPNYAELAKDTLCAAHPPPMSPRQRSVCRPGCGQAGPCCSSRISAPICRSVSRTF